MKTSLPHASDKESVLNPKSNAISSGLVVPQKQPHPHKDKKPKTKITALTKQKPQL